VVLESIVRIFDDVRGHTYDNIFDLVFTEKRILALRILTPFDGKSGHNISSMASLFVGSGFSRRNESIKRTELADKIRNSFKSMSLDELTSDSESCLEIPFSSVESISLSRGLLDQSIQISILGTQNARVKVKFHPDSEQLDEMQKILSELAPEKLI
jgi:hypothetical protein